MKFTPLAIPEVVLVEPDVHRDDRGFFLETWAQRRYAEAGRVLAKYASAHPDKKIVRAELLIPGATGSTKHLAYRYFRDQGRVAFGEVGETSLYLGPETSLEAMAAGDLDLSDDAREFCSKPRSGPSSTWCPWRDAYAEAKTEARRAAEREARR